MRINDLIDLLDELKDENGNIEVFIDQSNMDEEMQLVTDACVEFDTISDDPYILIY